VCPAEKVKSTAAFAFGLSIQICGLHGVAKTDGLFAFLEFCWGHAKLFVHVPLALKKNMNVLSLLCNLCIKSA